MMEKRDEQPNDGITINLKESGIAEFVKRPVPSQSQVEEFEKYVSAAPADQAVKTGNQASVMAEPSGAADSEIESRADFEAGFEDGVNGVSNKEIEESLEEIYQDDKGRRVDVKRMQVIRQRGVFFWFFAIIFSLGMLSACAYGGYNYFAQGGAANAEVEFFVAGEAEVLAGQEFFYEIGYKNNTRANLRVPRIEIVAPANFVILESEPESKNNENRIWDFDSIAPGTGGKIRLKGMMIGRKGETGTMFANLLYTPDDFSSEFKKEAAFSTLVKDIGLDMTLGYIKTALVKEANEIILSFNAQDKSFISNFRLTIEQLENVTLALAKSNQASSTAGLKIEESRPGVYLIDGVSAAENELAVNLTFNKKAKDSEAIPIRLEKIDAAGNYHVFWEDALEFEVLKSDLNLAMIVNGQREDQGVNFGDKLNFSIAYNNKGETALNDVVIMVVLESDSLDWTTLETPVKGREKGNTITWTKAEIPELSTLERHEEGTIDFSLSLLEAAKVEPGGKYQVKSFAQYSVGELPNGETPKADQDKQSNTVLNLINSDLKLIEEIRYFNDDNITVGNGPLPLQAGQKTSFKVYWSITNNLHELNDVAVEVSLPGYIEWDGKNRTNVGEVRYDAEARKAIWSVGRLPLSVFRADAEFNISVIPSLEDANKIMVLKPGSRVTAFDSETGAKIEKITEAKTSKLEDDPIALKTNDGVVRE